MWMTEFFISITISSFVFIIKRKKYGFFPIVNFMAFTSCLFSIGGIIAISVMHMILDISVYDVIVMPVDVIIKLIVVSIIVDISMCVLINRLHRAYRIDENDKKTYYDGILEIMGVSILPFRSLQAASIIAGILVTVFAITDDVMKPYGFWFFENSNINYEKSNYHLKCVRDYYDNYGYPLWRINGCDNEFGKHRETKKRILLLGDSFIWGDGSENSNYLWWRQLQQLIDKNGYSECEIVPVGYFGASAQDELNWLTQTDMLSQINPDLIIIGYVSNDGEYVNSSGMKVPKLLEDKDYESTLFFRVLRFLFPNVEYVLNQKLLKHDQNNSPHDNATGYPYEERELVTVSHEYLKKYKRTVIDPLADCLNNLDIPSFVVFTPSMPSLDYYEKRFGVIEKIYKKNGIRTYNPVADYVSAYANDNNLADGINIVNSHPGTATNKYIADYIYNIMYDNYAYVLGRKCVQQKEEIEVNDWFPHSVMPINNDGNIRFSYPLSDDENRFLYLPVGKSYIMLAFSHPVDIEEIQFECESLTCKEIELWVTHVDEEKGYDTKEMISIGRANNNAGLFKCNMRNVTSIRVHLKDERWEDVKCALKIINR